MKTTTITITGMHCPSCAMLLTDVLQDVNGVQEAVVSYKEGTALVTHDERTTTAQLRAAIEAEGYKAS